MITVYHNQRCGKSRTACQLLEEKGISFEKRMYLENPPTVKELEELLELLGIGPHELIRKGEDIYKEKYKGKKLSDAQWVQVMVDNPILIERPIVIKGDKAVVARPPERVWEVVK